MVFEPADSTWRKALDTRNYFYLYKWTWYEWLGALGPLVFFAWLWRFAEKTRRDAAGAIRGGRLFLCRLPAGMAMVLLAPSFPARLMPLQPMRYLHIEYFLFMMTAGAMLGRFLLKKSAWRWAVFLLAVNVHVGVATSGVCGVAHLELPDFNRRIHGCRPSSGFRPTPL